jgi:hypothetical protein
MTDFREEWLAGEARRMIHAAGLPIPSDEALAAGKAVLAAATYLTGAPHPAEECPLYYDGCLCTAENLRHNLDRAEVLDAVVQAVFEEIEFHYSHPHAADRGEVWVEKQKVSKLYLAFQAFRRWQEEEVQPLRRRNLELVERAVALVERLAVGPMVASDRAAAAALIEEHRKGRPA